MTQINRVSGGQIDRNRTLKFLFDGKTYTGHPGDTLASVKRYMGRGREEALSDASRSHYQLTADNEGMIQAIHELASRPVIVQIDGEAIAQATLDAQSQGFGG